MSRLPRIWWLLCVIPLLGWWVTGLLDLDEGFYAAVTGEMLRRGEWVTPYYNGSPWFEKPIWLYWVSIPTVWLFGQDVGPRLPSVAANCLLYAGIYQMVKRRAGKDAAQLAALFVATTLLTALLGRLMMTDAWLNLSLTLCFLFFFESLVTSDMRWRYAAGALLGVSVLAKGPIGGAFFLILAGLTYWREPALRPAFKRGWLISIALCAAVVSAWYVPAYLANGQTFVQKFLIEQNVGRFSGGDKAHTVGGFGYLLYIPVLLLGAAPWIFSLRQAVTVAKEPDQLFARYCLRWAATILVFFTVSAAKLPHYVLPCIPPLMIAIAIARARTTGLAQVFPRAAGMALGLFALLNAGLSTWYFGGTVFGTRITSGQAEAHALARKLRGTTEDIALYQLPRRQKSRGTGEFKIQETSLPSVIFYIDRPVLMTDDGMAIKPNSVVFSRPSRLADDPAFAPVEVREFFGIWRKNP